MAVKLSKTKREKFKKQGQYPRATKNWLRYRQEEPSHFSEFRIKEISKDTKLVLGKKKKTGKWRVQSLLKKRRLKKKKG